MTAYADSRPRGLDVPFRPGNSLSIELTWPTGELTGRTFASTLDGVALDLAVNGDVMTIEATEAQTEAVVDPADWLLTETTGGASNDLLLGTWIPSSRPGVSNSLALTVVLGEISVDVSVVSGQASIVALDGRLDAVEADTAQLTTDVSTLDTEKVDRAGDTMTGVLILPGMTLGTVPVTGTAGAPNIFKIDAALNTFHDFMLIPARGMTTSGTAADQSSADTGVPRIILAKGGRAKWAREVPAGWNQISLNLLFTKEASGSGNMHWQIAYDVINFLTGDSLIGSVTTVNLGGVSVPSTAGDSKYYIPPETQAIAAPAQLFGIPPLILVSLTRVNDGTDTYTGNAGLVAMSMSRTS